MEKINIILADDHAILRYGLRVFLSEAKDIEIAGEATTGDECLELFHQTNPDVCLIDIEMPGKNGIEVVNAIRKTDPHVKLIILSMHSTGALFQGALAADINGYLLKNIPKKKILQAIRLAANGQKVFSNGIAKQGPVSLHPQETSEERQTLHKKITQREKEILQLVVAGHSSQEIAQKLYISTRTVETHRNNIMQKLDMNNTASLVRFALQHNMVRIAHTSTKNVS